jgi:peptidylprolyl isomerase
MSIESKWRRRVGMWAAPLILALGACGDSTGPSIEVIEEISFHESVGVDLSAMTEAPSGLYYQDLVPGDGAELTSGADAVVEYLVRFRTGEVVGSSPSFEFTVGDPGLWDGFNLGVVGMRVGGQRKLVLPPALVNDSRFPGRVLIFDIDLLEIVAP